MNEIKYDKRQFYIPVRHCTIIPSQKGTKTLTSLNFQWSKVKNNFQRQLLNGETPKQKTPLPDRFTEVQTKLKVKVK